ncbi:MAG: NB-ARC domain-containing protein [Polyangiaceae bacterium]
MTVQFRFLTTASIGIEQGSPFGAGVGGIALWRDTVQSRNEQERLTNASLLRRFLLSEGVVAPAVLKFLRDASDKEVCRCLIDLIDWDTDAARTSEVITEIEKKLVVVGKNYGVPPSMAERVAPHLCETAFATATRPTGRFLDLPELLRLFEKLTHESRPRALYNGVAASAQAAPSPLGSPSLPWAYEARAELVDHLRTAIIGAAPGRPVALHGMGGCGKTTLAAAMAADSAVRAALPDGVLWATLGQEDPDLAGHLQAFASALGHSSMPSQRTPIAEVRRLMEGRRCLVVLDDAWRYSDVEALAVANAKSRLLCTTRQASIAHRLGATVVAVGPMEPAEAKRLFLRRVDTELLPDNSELIDRFLDRIEHLPLAIELGAAQVLAGRSLAKLLADLNEEIARLDTLDADRGEADDEPLYRRRTVSLEACFALSLQWLTESARRHFDLLGILREHAPITAAAARLLFGVATADAATEALRTLATRALLTPIGKDSDRWRMHDLLRDYARRRVAGHVGDASPGSDGIELGGITGAHGAFFGRCRDACSGAWSRIPDDPYLSDHLLWHAVQTGEAENVHDVLEEGDYRPPAWAARRVAAGQVAGLAVDLSLGASLATDAAKIADSGGHALHRLVAYGLVAARLKDHATWMPPPLVVRMVDAGLWPVERALAYARVSTEGPAKAWTMAALAPHLGACWDAQIGEEAVAAALPIADRTVFTQLGAETRLVKALSPRLRRLLLERSISRGPSWHAAALAALGRHAPAQVDGTDLERFEQVLKANDVSAEQRADALLRVVESGLLIFEGLKRVLQDLADRRRDPRRLFDGTHLLLPILTSTDQSSALSDVLSYCGAEKFVALLRHHRQVLHPNVASAMLPQARGIADPLYRAWAMGLLVNGLEGQQREQVRAEAITSLRGAHAAAHVRFLAWTDVGAVIGGSDGEALQLEGIDAVAAHGLSSVGTSALHEYARTASLAGRRRLGERLAAGTAHDRWHGLPGLLAVASETDIPGLCSALEATMSEIGHPPDLDACAHRIPHSALPSLINAAAPKAARIDEYAALAALARAASPAALAPIAERARKACGSLLPAERLRVASALAPEETLYEGAIAGALADDLEAEFGLRSQAPSRSFSTLGDLHQVLAAAAPAERNTAIRRLSVGLDRIPESRIDDAGTLLKLHLPPTDTVKHDPPSEPSQRAPTTGTMAKLSLVETVNGEVAFWRAVQFGSVLGVTDAENRAIRVFWNSLAEDEKRGALSKIFGLSQATSTRSYLQLLSAFAFVLGDPLFSGAAVNLLDTIPAILEPVWKIGLGDSAIAVIVIQARDVDA